MGHFVRVIRGNLDQAVRKILKQIQADPQMKITRGRPFHEKPTTRRRREHSEGIRRRERAALFENLRVVYARKARGF